MENNVAIIVAGGSGLRMGTEVPKQFLSIGQTPILMHTIRRFATAMPGIEIMVVLPETQTERWAQLCQKNQFQIPHRVVFGGGSRFQSVKNGILAIDGEAGIVAIHDGVRPLVSREIIRASFESAEAKGSGVAAIELKDSIRRVKADGHTEALDRSTFRIMQTPQTFRLQELRQAFEQEEQPGFTDDAIVMENAGFPIVLIEGAYDNIKITTPEDIHLAESLLKKGSA